MCKVSAELPADGLYNLCLYHCVSEENNFIHGGGCLVMVRQYEILLEGNIPL